MFRNAAPAPKPRPRRGFLKMVEDFLFLMAILIVIAAILFIWATNKHAGPQPAHGTRYAVTNDSTYGYGFIVSSNGKAYWGRVCQMAQGGIITLNKILFFRRDVPWHVVLVSVNKSAEYIYTPPPHPMPPLISTVPWCKSGFSHSLPTNTYITPLPD